MTEALKTDWLEQAKREIAEEHIGRPLGDLYNALIAERARNLELREQIEKLKTATNAWKGSSDGWDSWG